MSLFRLALASGLVVALAGCGGGGLGGILGGLNPIQCDTGTQVQLASPQAYQTGVPTNIGQIVVVANGNANNLGSTYGQWNLRVTDVAGNVVTTGSNLTPFDGRNLTHPFTSDFYYASNIGPLPAGTTLSVQLQETSQNCSPAPVTGTFST